MAFRLERHRFALGGGYCLKQRLRFRSRAQIWNRTSAEYGLACISRSPVERAHGALMALQRMVVKAVARNPPMSPNSTDSIFG